MPARAASLAATVVAFCSLMVVTDDATGALAVRKVRATKAGEFQPARSQSYLAWEQNTSAHPGRFNLYARRLGRRPFKVNAPGTKGANGGISRETLAYQQFRGKKSDIMLFDLPFRIRDNPPAGVNTRWWEYWPSISSRWLLFGRLRGKGHRAVILAERANGTLRTLARVRSRAGFLAPGQVRGDFATWMVCRPGTRCDVVRYRISTGERVKVPNPGAYQRAPSVTAKGTVYFARGPRRCGDPVELVRYPIGGPEEVLVRLREGVATADTYVFTDKGGDTHLYFERSFCGRPAKSNIYKIVDPRFFTVKIEPIGAGGGTVSADPSGILCPKDCAHSYPAGTAVTLTADPDMVSNFTGWGGGCSGSQSACAFTLDQPMKVTAFFDPASSFSLSVDKRGRGRGRLTSTPPGISCGKDCSQIFRAGTRVVLRARPRKGSVFAGWRGGCSGDRRCRLTMDRPRTAIARFKRRGH